MQWQDEGIVLATRRFGESGLLVDLLTRERGRHGGLVRGGGGRKAAPVLDVGNRVQATWRARLDHQLGQFTVEPLVLVANRLLDQPVRLQALHAACTLVRECLFEREPHPLLFNGLVAFGDFLTEEENERWPELYVRFELALLADLGFGLDLARCAVTGRDDDLVFVSPRTGRAVSREGAGEWAPRLLPLPAFLLSGGAASPAEIEQGLRLTGSFLQHHLFDATERAMPTARERLIASLTRRLQSPSEQVTTDGEPA
jgi:DNA repair protein RecO (recombination protein O)